MPVLSTTTSTFISPQGNSAGFLTARARIFFPSTMRFSLSWPTVPGKRRWVLSYFSSVASILLSVRSLMATTSNSFLRSHKLRNVNRPMRPKPLIATRIATFVSSDLAHLCTKNQTPDYSGGELGEQPAELAGDEAVASDFGG